MLLNLMHPGVDGIEPMKDITKPDGTPVIFVSAYGQDQLLAREFEAGAAHYVVKPSPQRSSWPGSEQPCGSGRRRSRQAHTSWST